MRHMKQKQLEVLVGYEEMQDHKSGSTDSFGNQDWEGAIRETEIELELMEVEPELTFNFGVYKSASFTSLKKVIHRGI